MNSEHLAKTDDADDLLLYLEHCRHSVFGFSIDPQRHVKVDQEFLDSLSSGIQSDEEHSRGELIRFIQSLVPNAIEGERQELAFCLGAMTILNKYENNLAWFQKKHREIRQSVSDRQILETLKANDGHKLGITRKQLYIRLNKIAPPVHR